MKSVLILFFCVLMVACTKLDNVSNKEQQIWQEFVDAVKKDEINVSRIITQPGLEAYSSTLLQFLKNITKEAIWSEWSHPAEIHHVNDKIHYLIPLTLNNHKHTYCISLILKKNKWYFHHLEAIFIRLDKMGSLPTSNFPDLSEHTKIWMREEGEWTSRIYLFNFLKKEKGKKFAINWFRDGMGYLTAARSWVPFVPEKEAFIRYLCWNENKIHGSDVVLEKLKNTEASVLMRPTFLLLYSRTGHLRHQIAYDDYKEILETMWQDRAVKAGWKLQIQYLKDDQIKLIFY